MQIATDAHLLGGWLRRPGLVSVNASVDGRPFLPDAQKLFLFLSLFFLFFFRAERRSQKPTERPVEVADFPLVQGKEGFSAREVSKTPLLSNKRGGGDSFLHPVLGLCWVSAGSLRSTERGPFFAAFLS